jgi:predicted nucleotidyltransferase
LSYPKLRDRDAIVTREGLIFRVFGYTHPKDAYICDAEYASSKIFRSTDLRAPRSNGKDVFYKFYEDESWRLIEDSFPQHLILDPILRRKVIGVRTCDIVKARKPEQRLEALMNQNAPDTLISSLQTAIQKVTDSSGLSRRGFGVFGSILHGFHHPGLSDLDFVIYGRKRLVGLRETLAALYENEDSDFRNEFSSPGSLGRKRWRYKNYSVDEYLWHQRRKLIYGLFRDARTGRVIKTEFEPVKDWNEIATEYDPRTCIPEGWVKIKARIMEDPDAPFIPSVYGIQPLELLSGPSQATEAKRVVSFMEEFRLQSCTDETVLVEGTLERVESQGTSHRQIALSYVPRYYEQVLKVVRHD